MKARALLVVVLMLLVAAPLLAQQPPRPPQPPGPNPGGPQGPGPGVQSGQPQGPPPDVVLREVLRFNDEQLHALQGLVETRQHAMENLQREIATTERALGEAAHSAEADPCQVGALFLGLEDLRRQAGEVQQTFRAGFEGLLSGEQKQQIEEVFGLQRALSAAEVLHRLGL